MSVCGSRVGLLVLNQRVWSRFDWDITIISWFTLLRTNTHTKMHASIVKKKRKRKKGIKKKESRVKSTGSQNYIKAKTTAIP